MALEDKYNRALLTKAELKNVLNKYGGNITDETVFREYPVIAQQLLESGGGGGGSGDLPTLFAPSISYSAGSGTLNITDGGNGNFAVKYALYADEVYRGETAEKSIKVTDFVEVPTETKTTVFKVYAKADNFNNSVFSNTANWNYVAVSEGTLGLVYSEINAGGIDGYQCIGIGTATDTEIEIASQIDGLPVLILKAKLFYYNTKITSVYIADSVINIMDEAFHGCSNLKNVHLSTQLTYIAKKAFNGCSSLESLIIPDSVKNLSDNVFQACTSITNLVIPDLITALPYYSFASCTALKTVELGANITSLGTYAFYNCSSLKRVDFSKSLKVPSMSNKNSFGGTHADLQIKVPASLIDEWKSATNWASYADKIVTEFTNEV